MTKGYQSDDDEQDDRDTWKEYDQLYKRYDDEVEAVENITAQLMTLVTYLNNDVVLLAAFGPECLSFVKELRQRYKISK
jgi:hypothetical protein